MVQNCCGNSIEVGFPASFLFSDRVHNQWHQLNTHCSLCELTVNLLLVGRTRQVTQDTAKRYARVAGSSPAEPWFSRTFFVFMGKKTISFHYCTFFQASGLEPSTISHFWCFSLFWYYNSFLYFPGEIPASFLNRRQKYCKDEKPLCRAHSSKLKNGYFINFFAFFNLTEIK